MSINQSIEYVKRVESIEYVAHYRSTDRDVAEPSSGMLVLKRDRMLWAKLKRRPPRRGRGVLRIACQKTGGWRAFKVCARGEEAVVVPRSAATRLLMDFVEY